ncbi:hypothetical protein CLV31_11815 [Algoriphagus aquaeductus]|uniref:Uncharacterized protein n=1 Tax=Algoriphagus aquaeductus TaxID=475299 RepID=A0A326RVX9_9BACT|nr:hypothetical protein [Algoriphagus aquaeductus]PZV78039.1 hypothetical protein CLV31_11815 [Algoriphagus aquaeductus]
MNLLLMSCVEEPEASQIEIDENSQIAQVKSWFEENKTKLRLPERGSNLRNESHGNREFSIMRLRDGTIEIYTSGADRLTTRFDQIASTMSQIFSQQYNLDPWVALNGIQFAKADYLWLSFLQGITKFAEQRGAFKTKNEFRVNRPNWDKVKEALDSNSPIPLNCN